MGSLGDELSLGQRRHSSIPTTICRSKIMNVAVEQGCKLEEHVQKLEEEKRKIQGSELELPLCLQMLNDAISYLKKETETDTQPLLKDFISLSKPIREEHDEELFKEKKFQLWRENDRISNARFSDTLEIERDEEKSSNSLYMLLSPGMTTPKVETGLGLGLTSSSMVKGRRKLVASSSVPQPPPYLQQQSLRKQRRCWTPELHRLFVDALQQLGGPGVATPKQIREHMQEEGLTNDEVKSHLQKYRLHIRKSDSNLEKQSVVVLGFNLWNSSQEVEESGEGGETSKRNNSQSDSPQGPLQLPCTTTTTCGDSSMEDAEDAKSERRY
ncbi:transcription factor HHO6 [Brassica rapa]|uniref:HTH myb-type domain-containing protein n=1 Tax=Brassica campestris TaxID=3711 RepID=M4FHT4_BRACM|nr:transcription factor HHO6 [Brassica rapa]